MMPPGIHYIETYNASEGFSSGSKTGWVPTTCC